MEKLFFASDNGSGIHPDILKAISDANRGYATAYGDDIYTERAIGALRDAFGSQAEVYFTFNGTGANVLGIASLARSYETIFCTDCAHLWSDECAAPEKFFGGKLTPVPAAYGKLTPDHIAGAMGEDRGVHHAVPKAISITQPTEWGTVYQIDEITAITAFARTHGMYVHMDGARLANAAVALDCSLAEMTTDAGVDVVSFGGTKNGLMGGEAVVFVNPRLAQNSGYLRKQLTQLSSKMRFIAVQFEALMHDDLWRRNAAHANQMARRLEHGIQDIVELELVAPVEINALFPRLSPSLYAAIRERCQFYLWDESELIARWMTSFNTPESEVDAFVQLIRDAAAANRSTA